MRSLKIIDGHMHILQWERSDGKSTFDVIEEYRENNRIAYATDAATTQPAAKMAHRAESVLKFLEADEKFLFAGTNSVHGIQLEREHLENILYKNHERDVGVTPRDVNRVALKKYMERYLPLMPDSRSKHMAECYYRKNLRGL